METCCICFDDDENLITPKHCSCKIKLHEKCLILLKDNGMLCPICKVNNYIVYPIRRRGHFRHIFQRDGNILERIIETPLALFELYPNFFTFLIVLVCSLFFSLFVLLPLFSVNYFLNVHFHTKIILFAIPIITYLGYKGFGTIIQMWTI